MRSVSEFRLDVLGGLVLVLVLLMAHEAEEHGGEEHEDERLEEGDEEFEEGQGDGEGAGREADAGPGHALEPHEGRQHDDRGEQDVAAHHVREEADRESDRLDEDAGELDRDDAWQLWWSGGRLRLRLLVSRPLVSITGLPEGVLRRQTEYTASLAFER